MKRERASILSVRQPITPLEKQKKIHYYAELNRLGINIPFDGVNTHDDDINYLPFKSKAEYNIAKNQAVLYLIDYKPVPKDLEEKLLAVKRNREKIPANRV